MIKFTASLKNGRTLVGLGITHENVERLKQGQPISVDLGAMVRKGTDSKKLGIVILYGETAAALHKELGDLIGPETRIHIGNGPLPDEDD